MDTFTKPLITQICHPRFKWIILTHIDAPTWNDDAIYIHYIHLLQIFPQAVIHMAFVRVPSKKLPVEQKGI